MVLFKSLHGVDSVSFFVCLCFSSPGAPQTLPEGLGEARANRPVDQAPSGLQSSLGQRSASNFCKVAPLRQRSASHFSKVISCGSSLSTNSVAWLGQRSAPNLWGASSWVRKINRLVQQLYLERSKHQNVFCAALLLDSHV